MGGSCRCGCTKRLCVVCVVTTSWSPLCIHLHCHMLLLLGSPHQHTHTASPARVRILTLLTLLTLPVSCASPACCNHSVRPRPRRRRLQPMQARRVVQGRRPRTLQQVPWTRCDKPSRSNLHRGLPMPCRPRTPPQRRLRKLQCLPHGDLPTSPAVRAGRQQPPTTTPAPAQRPAIPGAQRRVRPRNGIHL